MNNELGFSMKISFFYEDIAFLTESQEMERIALWKSYLSSESHRYNLSFAGIDDISIFIIIHALHYFACGRIYDSPYTSQVIGNNMVCDATLKNILWHVLLRCINKLANNIACTIKFSAILSSLEYNHRFVIFPLKLI